MDQPLADKHDKRKEKLLSNEYIRGLVTGEGCFSFHTGWKRKNGRKYKMPAFYIGMHERDETLLKMVRNSMNLKNQIYNHKSWHGDGSKRGRMASLVVRDFSQLKDIIIPFFYKKLKGYKAIQFMDWIEKIGSDPDISDRYKSLYRLYKWGHYEKLLDKFS